MVATRFAVAIHIMMLLARGLGERATSQVLARSVNTNPVVVRRITGQLARAGLIRVRRGPGGAELARAASLITLGDIWGVMNPCSTKPLLPVHASPDLACPVGRQVHVILGRAFEAAEAAMQQSLHRTTLASLVQCIAPGTLDALHIVPESCALSS